MLKGYIIEKYSNMTGAYTCNRLVEEAVKRGVDLRIVGIADSVVCEDGIYVKTCDGEGEYASMQLLKPCDFVINRYKYGHVKDAIGALAKRTYNDAEAFKVYINKYMQVKNLKSKGFKFKINTKVIRCLFNKILKSHYNRVSFAEFSHKLSADVVKTVKILSVFVFSCCGKGNVMGDPRLFVIHYNCFFCAVFKDFFRRKGNFDFFAPFFHKSLQKICVCSENSAENTSPFHFGSKSRNSDYSAP